MTLDPALQLREGSLVFFFLSLILRQTSAHYHIMTCGFGGREEQLHIYV